jgi:hypothetical protein
MQHLRTLTVIHVYALKRETFELDGHVGGRARGEAEIVSEAVAWVGRRNFCWVRVSGGGTGAIASAANREPAEKRFEEEGENEEGGVSPCIEPLLMSIYGVGP